jgi:hypothetical protein
MQQCAASSADLQGASTRLRVCTRPLMSRTVFKQSQVVRVEYCTLRRPAPSARPAWQGTTVPSPQHRAQRREAAFAVRDRLKKPGNARAAQRCGDPRQALPATACVTSRSAAAPAPRAAQAGASSRRRRARRSRQRAVPFSTCLPHVVTHDRRTVMVRVRLRAARGALLHVPAEAAGARVTRKRLCALARGSRWCWHARRAREAAHMPPSELC